MTELPVVQQGNVLISQVFGILVVIHVGDDTPNPYDSVAKQNNNLIENRQRT